MSTRTLERMAGWPGGSTAWRAWPMAEADFGVHLAGHRERDHGHPASVPVLRRALAVWTRLHGALSLELAGHCTGMGSDPEILFEAELDGLVRSTPPDRVE